MYPSTAESKENGLFAYDAVQLKAQLEAIIRQNIAVDAFKWLIEKVQATNNAHQLNSTFAAIPRKTGKATIRLTEEQQATIQLIHKGFTIRGWTIDRLCRVWLLMHVDPSEQEEYIRKIENLFLAAEMNELVALYAALPVLAYPEKWQKRCAEGIRSNISDVLTAIMCNNPYPSEYLDEPAWNQLVLKAFFTEKPIHQIIGLDERANQELANILSDYAHERWAAHRPVNPQLWRCVGKFINAQIFQDIERIANSENSIERKAAALACSQSNYPPAKDLLNKNSDLKSAIEKGELTWEIVAQQSIVKNEE